ncbi:MAG TPA: PP2C family protein-serine/threonine phosphatase, partial [Armatimonadota bacterium]|nr:PP2C family protein-serine/threonine phosphatase [Armatimonadota bacterium]
AFAGFLSERLRLWHRRYQAGRDEARERELEDRIAEREFQLARAMQRAAMPSVPPAIPGLELAVRSRFARQVSGDFYMFLPDEKSVGVIIGDVSGKGLPAALVSTSIGHLLPWLHPLRSPGNALKNLNRDLLDRLPTESFVSLTLINLDLARGCVTLWNCGHPPPLLWRAREQRLVEGTLFNPVLGIFAGWEGHPERWDCEPGDVLLLCTDGLLEVRNADGEQFEAQRAGATLAEHAALPAEEIADALLRAAESWGTLTDDVTLVVCKRVPVAPGAGEPLHGSPYPG